MVTKIETSQHAKYTCSFCGKTKMQKVACGDLAVWFPCENGSWWCLDLHHYGHHCKGCHTHTHRWLKKLKDQ
ncbi:60S ribosomal protein L37a [Manis javanica]|nr:60S ribosomal protein L37a [Manis javanica]